jgi:uncharacterized RDD family membrane protein YckC
MNTYNQTLTTTKKASFWKRLIAMHIDMLLMSIISWLIQMTFKLSDTSEYWIYFGLYYTYGSLMETYYQQTIGKMILKIRVIKTNGEKPEFLSSFYRNFGKVVSTLPLFYGYLRVLAPHQRQTIHDEIGNCLVIETRQ